MSVDPKADLVPNWSPYNYSFNNPTKFVDPNGEFPFLFGIAVLAVASIVMNPDNANCPGPGDPTFESKQLSEFAFEAGATIAGGLVLKEMISTESDNTSTSNNGESIKANKEKGDNFRDEIADGMESEGYNVEKEVVKETPFGRRVIDIEVSKDDKVLGGIEAKKGKNARYNPDQRSKDEYLKDQGYPVNLIHDKEDDKNK